MFVNNICIFKGKMSLIKKKPSFLSQINGPTAQESCIFPESGLYIESEKYWINGNFGDKYWFYDIKIWYKDILDLYVNNPVIGVEKVIIVFE